MLTELNLATHHMTSQPSEMTLAMLAQNLWLRATVHMARLYCGHLQAVDSSQLKQTDLPEC